MNIGMLLYGTVKLAKEIAKLIKEQSERKAKEKKEQEERAAMEKKEREKEKKRIISKANTTIHAEKIKLINKMLESPWWSIPQGAKILIDSSVLLSDCREVHWWFDMLVARAKHERWHIIISKFVYEEVISKRFDRSSAHYARQVGIPRIGKMQEKIRDNFIIEDLGSRALDAREKYADPRIIDYLTSHKGTYLFTFDKELVIRANEVTYQKGQTQVIGTKYNIVEDLSFIWIDLPLELQFSIYCRDNPENELKKADFEKIMSPLYERWASTSDYDKQFLRRFSQDDVNRSERSWSEKGKTLYNKNKRVDIFHRSRSGEATRIRGYSEALYSDKVTPKFIAEAVHTYIYDKIKSPTETAPPLSHAVFGWNTQNRPKESRAEKR